LFGLILIRRACRGLSHWSMDTSFPLRFTATVTLPLIPLRPISLSLLPGLPTFGRSRAYFWRDYRLGTRGRLLTNRRISTLRRRSRLRDRRRSSKLHRRRFDSLFRRAIWGSFQPIRWRLVRSGLCSTPGRTPTFRYRPWRDGSARLAQEAEERCRDRSGLTHPPNTCRSAHHSSAMLIFDSREFGKRRVRAARSA
jgi:hypothetical protein